MKKAQALLAASLLAPTVALAFETVDSLPWPSSGRFPAYAGETARPTDLWVHGGLMRDNNLLRVEVAGRGDTVMRLGAGFRTAQRVIGRQSLSVEARGDFYSFNEFTQLDHFAYSGAADWRWEVGNDLAGSIALGRERRLADLSETRSPRRSMVTATRLSGTAGYMITSRLRLRGGLSGTVSQHDTRDDAETRAAGAVGAVEYVSPLGNTLGWEVRGGTFGRSRARTAKTVRSVRLLHEEREFQGDPRFGLGLLPLRDETVKAVRFGFGWEPQRHWQAGFALDRGTRESNFVDRDYNFTALTLDLAWRY